jgi:hypothetical protein
MSTYRVKAGSNQTLASLTVLDPQPDPGTAIETTRRSYSANGSTTDQGRYIELPFSALASSGAYQSLLTLFGLSADISTAPVTVYVRDETYAWRRMNGNAIRPIPGKQVNWGDRQSRPLNIVILIRDLETISYQISVSDSISVGESAAVS